MRVALDARILDLPGGERGFGVYVHDLVQHLAPLVDLHLVVLEGNESKMYERFPQIRKHVVTKSCVHGGSRFDDSGKCLEDSLREREIEIYHSTLQTLPALSLTSVVTLYDLIPVKLPGYFQRKNIVQSWRQKRQYLRNLQACKRADRFVAISAYSAQEAVEYLDLDPNKVTVTPLAASPFLRRMQGDKTPVGVKDYFLYIGSLVLREKRRELDVLLQAFALLPETIRLRHLLVLAGKCGKESERLEWIAKALGVHHQVVFAGYVRDDQKAALYTHARALVFPSLYEGFGLPVLEALQCGTPVITYRNTSLIEVGGGLARFVESGHPHRLSEELSEISTNMEFVERVRQTGPEHARSFSWKQTAALTKQCYVQALSAKTTP